MRAAVLYEAITTITTIYPNANLVAAAAKSISRFLTSTNANLKYLGITALAAIVKVGARCPAGAERDATEDGQG